MTDYGWQITLVSMSLAGLVLSFCCDLMVRREGRLYSKACLSMAAVSAVTLAVLALNPIHAKSKAESVDRRIERVMELAAFREAQRLGEER